MPSQEKLRALAKLTVRSGLGLKAGQDLILGADITCVELARMVMEEAYDAGANAVIPFLFDEQMTLIRFNHGSDDAIGYAVKWLPEAQAKALNEGTAYLRITNSDPGLLKAIDKEKVAKSMSAAAAAGKPTSEAISGGATNWCIIPAASPAWAKQIFPDDDTETAVEKLWELIFKTTRSDQPDPVAAWDKHCAEVEKRMNHLNSHKFESLHFYGGGTDLTVGLAEGHIWEGVRMYAKNGTVCSPNIPTEEVFTMPHRDRVNGVVKSTKPLSLRGNIVDGIQMTFENGVCTKMSAEKGEDVLQKLLDTDEGARRLGEIALVPHSSPISQSGVIFFNTLFDENASCHMAMGNCYTSNMEGYDELSEDERRTRGANESMIHVDWMIGSAEVNLDGIKSDGTVVPLMRGCEWV